METSYGALKDKWDGIRSLATLAFAKYRDPYFRNELLVALKIIQDGHIAREKFVSSWAGAMGQTQFMPTNFVDYAVDFNGDGKRDIWTNVPDVLASTANYFAKAAGGWKMGVPWGFEVDRAAGLRPDEEPRRRSRSGASSACKRADGKAFPASRRRHSVLPGRPARPAFIVTPNFDVIKDYNNSDVYALAIGHLSDLMQGGGAVQDAVAGAGDAACRATTGSRCRRSSPSSATTRRGFPPTSISRCATSSAPSRRSTASSPTAIRTRRCWTKMGVKRYRRPLTWRVAFSASSRAMSRM